MAALKVSRCGAAPLRFDGFLSAAEAAAVIAVAGPRMKRAGVTTDDGKVRGETFSRTV